ncbi:hypothetical protein BS50DRAFT_588960 [Corynespora cassiicola Philippines]|uniref:Uncharacterized protein n=1 Tax=Corynespora cassiicola Philippines TaxID=1448308 RepID=A0A2T2NLF1_CORCC|nr:hypothetical protein BS50DRAFT_588960 [Corynespora cassiicola Philippines]
MALAAAARPTVLQQTEPSGRCVVVQARVAAAPTWPALPFPCTPAAPQTKKQPSSQPNNYPECEPVSLQRWADAAKAILQPAGLVRARPGHATSRVPCQSHRPCSLENVRYVLS